MTLSSGTRLGAYEILSLLGEGGMGQVYRAKDTRLKREVALKILPDAFAADPERVARFQREAELLATLNHPNIAGIYGLEQADGMRALVLELVEGPTLADRLAHGPIPVDEALLIAGQIANALEAAHEKGIIHRDLKPANIKLAPDDTVKVLDFGLAKLAEPAVMTTGAVPSVTASPTITTPAVMTGVGMILGTAAYMSPEQAKGRPADKRSDMWAFGCVLFEMLTGRRAFDGEDVAETLAFVLSREPDWKALPAETPGNIDRVLRRCLQKDPQRRLSHVAVLIYEIDEWRGVSAAERPDASRNRPITRWGLRAAVPVTFLIGGALAAFIARGMEPTARPGLVARFSLTLPEAERITDPHFRSVAISPDGSRIVYVANRRLHLRSMSDPGATVISGTELGTPIGTPAFSPDGRSIAFVSGLGGSGAAIKKIEISGGVPVTLAETNSNNVLGLAWVGDDILFADSNSGLMRLSASSGRKQVIVPPSAEEVIEGPTLLPSADVALFTVANRRATGVAVTADIWDRANIVALRLRTGERKTLIEGGSDPHYLSNGQLLYAVGGTLFVVPLDVKHLNVTGERVAVLNGVARTFIGLQATGMAQFGVSDTGSAVYITGPASPIPGASRLALVDRAGKVDPSGLKLSAGLYERPRISPDAKQLAFGSEDVGGANIWIYDLSTIAAPRQLTFEGSNHYPVWSADGRHVAFQSDRDGDAAIFQQRSDGTARAERLTKPEPGTSHMPESWSSDGDHLLYSVEKGGANSLWVFSMKTKKTEPFSRVQSPRLISATFSPDGQWVAYTITNGAANQVLVEPFPATGEKHLAASSGARPQWSRDGKELFFYNTVATYVVNVTTRPTFSVTNPVALPFNVYSGRGPGFGRDGDIMPDGRHFIAVVPSADAPADVTSTRQFQLVFNWFEELKQRVPTK